MMNNDDKKGNSGIQVSGNFSMSGGALAVGKNAKAVNKLENTADITALVNALMTLRNAMGSLNLPDKGRDVINKKLDKLETSLKSDQPEAVMTVLDELNDNLEMANINIAQISTIAQPLDMLKQWASASRSHGGKPDK